MLDDIEGLNDQRRRDLGADDDLELMLDHDQNHQQKQLKNKIVFAMQGLGAIRTIKRNDKTLVAYIKGPHCEQSIKDLVKFIRQDSPANPKARLILSKYNIIESDLIELLILQVEDKKLSFWLIALMALLTEGPSDQLNVEQKEALMQSLREYKNAFVKHECFQILMVHIADYYKTPEEGRQRAHMQMLQFTILLIRNLAQIGNGDEESNLHNHFLATFVREDMLSPLLYIIQSQKSQLMSKIDIALLEIFYHTFTCFNPTLLYAPKRDNKFYARMSSKGNQNLPTRHSRFLPTFQYKSSTGVNRVSHKLGQQDKIIAKQKKPANRVTELKKVQKIDQQYLSQNFMQMQIEVLEGLTHKYKSLGELIFEICKEFIEVQFEQVTRLVFDSIYKQVGKVSDQNVIQYLLLCGWALQMVRARYHKERQSATSQQQKCQVEFRLSHIAEVMQNAHFQLIYRILFREATRQKRKQFKINTFHAGLSLLNSYLDVICDISTSMSLSDRKNANVLMGNMFRHDIAKIFRAGFQYAHHEKILRLLIIVCHKFFKLLSTYSDGKVLTIQTNKLLKRNKKKSKEDEYDEQIAQFISEDEQEQNGQESYNQNEQVKKKKKVVQREEIDEMRFQERKYNEKTQFAILAEYGVISKYLVFLKDERFAKNDSELNEAIFYYIRQIKKLLEGQWLFYQAETICVFQKIIAHQEFCRQNKQNAVLIQQICRSFINLLATNPLALIESLFRYNNLSLKDRIIKNYEEGYGEGEREQNMFTDD